MNSKSVQSLASLVKRDKASDTYSSIPNSVPKPQPSVSRTTPFATESSLEQQIATFDAIERKLTGLMTEKTTLEEELSRLHQRGGKTLKERTRLVQVTYRSTFLTKL